MVTHDVEDTISTDRVIVLEKGKIVMDGTVKSVFKNIDKIKDYKLKMPFIMELSIKLFNKGIIKNIYFDKRKLVDELWKLS